jgi:branched-chain amino acid transport system permease protein
MSYALISGLMVSGTYLLLSLGFTLMLRIADIVNLAHGSFVAGGMYLVILLVNDLNVPYLPSIPLAVLLGLLPCLLMYELVLRNARREGHRPQIIYTLLLLSLLQVVMQIGFGPDLVSLQIEARAWDVLGIAIRQEQVIGFFVAVVVCVALFVVFRFTAVGKSVEIAGKYPDGARAIGLPVERLYRLVFLTGSAMALLAGALIIPTAPASPFVGLDYLVTAVVIAFAARLSFPGCVATSLLYGVGYQLLLWITDKPPVATILIYAILLAVIAITPYLGELRKLTVRVRRPAVAGGAS